MDTRSAIVSLLAFDSLLSTSLFVIAYYGYFIYKRLEKLASIVSGMDSYNQNLARDIGNRFSDVDSSLVTMSRSCATAFGSVKDELGEFKSLVQELREPLQQFIHAQYETNRDIINVLQAVDTRVEHHVALLQGCPPDDDELPLVEKPDLTDLATSLYQVRDIVEAFKNDLITQVRLSREDYEELMTAAESKGELLPQQLNDLRLALGALQAQLADFRSKFDTFTAD